MTDKDTIIRALKYCCYDIHDGDCNPDCPYYDACSVGSPVPAVMYEVLVLLWEQEPRVMTLEEVKHSADWLWYDLRNVYQGWAKVEDCDSEWITWNDFTVDQLRKYGDQWRCWTSRPSPKQMRETPWEGEDDD